MELSWNYAMTTKEPTIKYLGHEVSIGGQFGSIRFTQKFNLKIHSEVFAAYKITFKSSPEHKLGNALMEMNVHHKSMSGNRAIASFLIEADNDMVRPNEFFDSI